MIGRVRPQPCPRCKAPVSLGAVDFLSTASRQPAQERRRGPGDARQRRADEEPKPAEEPILLDEAYIISPPAASTDERTMGMLCHLLGIFTWFLGPLIIWLIHKDKSQFVNQHGKEALNFNINMLVAQIIVYGGGLIFALATCGVGFLLIYPLLLGILVYKVTLGILACQKAHRGEFYRYPATIWILP
jgi:uncharacterized Tic20 family protein